MSTPLKPMVGIGRLSSKSWYGFFTRSLKIFTAVIYMWIIVHNSSTHKTMIEQSLMFSWSIQWFHGCKKLKHDHNQWPPHTHTYHDKHSTLKNWQWNKMIRYFSGCWWCRITLHPYMKVISLNLQQKIDNCHYKAEFE